MKQLIIILVMLFTVLFTSNFVAPLDDPESPTMPLESVAVYIEETTQTISRSAVDTLPQFTATAYDLSFASCGKSKKDPVYGITANGFDLDGLTREQALTIAVDPAIIPLGFKVLLEFENEYSKYDGIYTANDTGSAIKGNRIDVFIPDHQEALDFGKTKVFLEIF